MPYPDNVTAIPEQDADDYFTDAAGILETAIRHADKVDDLKIGYLSAEAIATPKGVELSLDITARLRLNHRPSDPSDVALAMPLSLAQLFAAIGADMMKPPASCSHCSTMAPVEATQ